MKKDVKKLASFYVKIVEWNDEDGCYVGRCPELFFGGTHGDNEAKVYAALCELAEAAVEDLIREGKALPAVQPQNYGGKFVLRTGPDLHKALALRAVREGKSLNQVCLDAIKRSAALTA